jgi:GrpB-like predicted nucleotidyltransferase (UPF0157 family)
MSEPVVVVAHDPKWAADFEEEKERIVSALADRALEVEHVGSTAIPGLAAKPVLDVAVALQSINEPQEAIRLLEAAGYERRPAGDFPGRLFLRRFEGARRMSHLSLAELGSGFWREHLAFRDALRADPELADRYADLKRSLAAAYGSDREAYTEGKNSFVREVLDARLPS